MFSSRFSTSFLSPYITLMMVLISFSFMLDKEKLHAGWPMHVIDDTSLGADGVKLGDLNGDGYEDIVCGWEQGHVARVYLNPYPDRMWTFIQVPAPDVEDALMMDLDGDGVQDLVTFSEGDYQRITFHWAPADGRVPTSESWVSTDVPASIHVTQWMFGQPMDVDHRNGTDIIVASKNQGALVGWLESPENPRDVAAWKLHTISEAGWVMSVEVIDMNDDGQQDILISDRKGDDNGVKWFQHPGHDSPDLYQPWIGHTIGMKGRHPMFLGIRDTPQTGSLEIWVPDSEGSIFHFTRIGLSGKFWKSAVMPFPQNAGRIGKSAAIGDINGDGRFDLVTTYEGAEYRLGVMWSTFDPKNNSWIHHDVSGLEGRKFDFAVLRDMDRDGDLDILTTEENNNSRETRGLGLIWYENPLHR